MSRVCLKFSLQQLPARNVPCVKTQFTFVYPLLCKIYKNLGIRNFAGASWDWSESSPTPACSSSLIFLFPIKLSLFLLAPAIRREPKFFWALVSEDWKKKITHWAIASHLELKGLCVGIKARQERPNVPSSFSTTKTSLMEMLGDSPLTDLSPAYQTGPVRSVSWERLKQGSWLHAVSLITTKHRFVRVHSASRNLASYCSRRPSL